MEYRKLGQTDIDVSAICLGTMTWGQQNTEKEAHEQLNYAIDQEINFIDTAELYPVPAKQATQGSTEAFIGSWLKQRRKRDDLIIASKIAGPAGEYTKHIRPDIEYSRVTLKVAVEGSLRRLQTDYIDLYQIHWPARATNFFGRRGYYHRENWKNNIEEILISLETFIKEGKIRHIGISNETPWGMMEYIRQSEISQLPRIQSVQNPYNLLNRLYEIGLAEMSIREETGLLAYSPMAFGLLSGKYHRGEDRPEDRINQFSRMSRYKNLNCHEATNKYLQLANEIGMSLAQMSLAFVNQQQFVTSNIIGATSMIQLKENIDSVNLKLDRDVIKAINKIHEEIPNPAP